MKARPDRPYLLKKIIRSLGDTHDWESMPSYQLWTIYCMIKNPNQPILLNKMTRHKAGKYKGRFCFYTKRNRALWKYLTARKIGYSLHTIRRAMTQIRKLGLLSNRGCLVLPQKYHPYPKSFPRKLNTSKTHYPGPKKTSLITDDYNWRDKYWYKPNVWKPNILSMTDSFYFFSFKKIKHTEKLKKAPKSRRYRGPAPGLIHGLKHGNSVTLEKRISKGESLNAIKRKQAKALWKNKTLATTFESYGIARPQQKQKFTHPDGNPYRGNRIAEFHAKLRQKRKNQTVQ